MGDENADDDRGHGHGHGRPCQGKKTGGAGAASVLPLLVTSSSSSSFSSLPSSSTLSSSGTGVRTKTILVLVVLLVAIVQFGDVIRSAAPLVLSTPPALSSKKNTTFHPPSTTPIPPSSLSSGVDNDDDKDDARNGSPAGTTAFDSLVVPRNNNSSDAESAAAAQPPLEPSNGDTNEEAGGGAPSQPPSPTPASFHPTPLRQPLPSSPTKQQQHSTKAHLLQNQTFSNWTVLAHQLPVPSNSFRNVYPNGLRLAFIGDSLTRYQVLSLMYYLHNHGQKWQPDSEQPNLVTQKTKAYKNDWNIYFNITSHMLGEASGKHKCDCYRGVTDPARIFENRYFRDVKGNNYIYFLTKLGRAPSRGRWWPSDVNKWEAPHSFRSKNGRAKWNYPTWDELIRKHIAKLRPKPTHVIFNEGIWSSHDLYDNRTFVKIATALQETNMTGIYKTTTKRSHEQTPDLLRHDAVGCASFLCLDLSWTHVLVGFPYYWDYGTHFSSHVNALFNQQLFHLLHQEHEQAQRQQSDPAQLEPPVQGEQQP